MPTFFPKATRISRPHREGHNRWSCDVRDFYYTVIFVGHGSSPEEARDDARSFAERHKAESDRIRVGLEKNHKGKRWTGGDLIDHKRPCLNLQPS